MRPTIRLIRPEIRWIQSNDHHEWPEWQPSTEEEELQWFTVAIGEVGVEGADNFQVAVATPRAITRTASKRRGRYVGLVIDSFDATTAEAAIHNFVASLDPGISWRDVVEQLETVMRWEFRGMSRI